MCYREYPWYQIVLRRSGVLVMAIGAFPILLFQPYRSQFYSYLHRIWCKTSEKPVWLSQSEQVDNTLS